MVDHCSNGMKTHGAQIGLIAVAAALAAGCDQLPGSTTADAGRQWQMVERYCAECHNETELAGDIAFDKLGPESVAAHPDVFEKAVRKLRGRMMPPPKEPRPEDEQLVSFVSWLERSLDEAAVANPRYENVGLHRLNRKEYEHAVRDLLALRSTPSSYCRRTTRSRVSTTSRARCRCRRRSSSST